MNIQYFIKMESIIIKKDMCRLKRMYNWHYSIKLLIRTQQKKNYSQNWFCLLVNISLVVLLQQNGKYYLSSSTPSSVRWLYVSLRLDLRAAKTGPCKKHNNVTYFVLNSSFGYVNTSSFWTARITLCCQKLFSLSFSFLHLHRRN